jgi:peptidoglycan/xylan/chitin deacetylase (PgdA/CDA1 family)
MDSLAEEPTVGHIELALQNLPRGLDETYKQAMKRIESQRGSSRELAKKVLSWIVHAKRALSAGELQHAVAVEPGKAELNENFIPNIEIVGSICAGLVTVDTQSNIVRLVHYTTQEYFEGTRNNWFPNAELNITAISATYLSFNVFQSGFCQANNEFEERLRLNQLYDYAAHNWGHHACKALTKAEASNETMTAVMAFLENTAKVEASVQTLLHRAYSRYGQQVPRQMTGLHLAAYFGVKEAANTLLSRWNNADLMDSYGRTPLSWAAANGHVDVVKLLLENGAQPGWKDKNSQTPLSRAVECGSTAVIQLLLGKKVEVDFIYQIVSKSNPDSMINSE